MIELRALTVGYGDREVLREIDLDILPGQVLALVGPNGCGKSTLLRTVLGLQPRLGGELRIDGVDAEVLTPRQRARKVAYLAQSRTTPNITARRMVLHGRFPYLSYPRRYSREDREAVEWALAQVDAAALADRPMEELSGGQRQRAHHLSGYCPSAGGDGHCLPHGPGGAGGGAGAPRPVPGHALCPPGGGIG